MFYNFIENSTRDQNTQRNKTQLFMHFLITNFIKKKKKHTKTVLTRNVGMRKKQNRRRIEKIFKLKNFVFILWRCLGKHGYKEIAVFENLIENMPQYTCMYVYVYCV